MPSLAASTHIFFPARMDARDQFFGRGGDRKQQLSETESWVLIK
jgi:hypothetical protein